MEARVAALEGLARQTVEVLGRLEAGQKSITSDLGKIESQITRLDTAQRKTGEDVAELKGRVSQLPTFIQMLGFVLAVLAITGLVRVFAP